MNQIETATHKVSFRRTFSAAHRIMGDPGKCHNIHGHNYQVEVIIACDDLDHNNFAIPFNSVKDVIDFFDHTLILEAADEALQEIDDPLFQVRYVDGPPSTEFMADLIARQVLGECLAQDRDDHYRILVTLSETDNILAQGYAEHRD